MLLEMLEITQAVRNVYTELEEIKPAASRAVYSSRVLERHDVYCLVSVEGAKQPRTRVLK